MADSVIKNATNLYRAAIYATRVSVDTITRVDTDKVPLEVVIVATRDATYYAINEVMKDQINYE